MFRRALRAAWVRTIPPKPRPLILMYHRIADQPLDPWGTAVSPDHFAEHLEVLCRIRCPLPLIDFVRRLQDGTLPRHAVAVTFDDGYLDNLLAGKPRLTAAGVPATVFLATGYLGQAGDFWWDELTQLILLGRGPSQFEITMGTDRVTFNVEASTALTSNSPWRAWLETPRTGRETAYLAIWRYLRTIGVQDREMIMAGLREIFSPSREGAKPGRSMVPEEVRTLVDDGLISIGPHTVTHQVLTGVDPSTVHHEIFASKRECELLTGREVGAFAYPFGSLDAEIKATVAAAGFVCACSTRRASISQRVDLFALPRIHVLNESGDTFERSLHHTAFVRD